MSIFANLFVLIVAAAAFITAACIHEAPEGYEDETGFHLGRKPARVKARRFEDYHPAGHN